jgi:hypothetical protein
MRRLLVGYSSICEVLYSYCPQSIPFKEDPAMHTRKILIIVVLVSLIMPFSVQAQSLEAPPRASCNLPESNADAISFSTTATPLLGGSHQTDCRCSSTASVTQPMHQQLRLDAVTAMFRRVDHHQRLAKSRRWALTSFTTFQRLVWYLLDMPSAATINALIFSFALISRPVWTFPHTIPNISAG